MLGSIDSRQTNFFGLAVTDENYMMSSLEVSKITEKPHKEVMRSVRHVLNSENSEGRGNWKPCVSIYPDSKGRSQPCYRLSRELVMRVIATYKAPQRNKVIQRMLEIDRNKQPGKPKEGKVPQSIDLFEAKKLIKEILDIGQILETDERVAKAYAIQQAEALTGLHMQPLLTPHSPLRAVVLEELG